MPIKYQLCWHDLLTAVWGAFVRESVGPRVELGLDLGDQLLLTNAASQSVKASQRGGASRFGGRVEWGPVDHLLVHDRRKSKKTLLWLNWTSFTLTLCAMFSQKMSNFDPWLLCEREGGLCEALRGFYPDNQLQIQPVLSLLCSLTISGGENIKASEQETLTIQNISSWWKRIANNDDCHIVIVNDPKNHNIVMKMKDSWLPRIFSPLLHILMVASSGELNLSSDLICYVFLSFVSQYIYWV